MDIAVIVDIQRVAWIVMGKCNLGVEHGERRLLGSFIAAGTRRDDDRSGTIHHGVVDGVYLEVCGHFSDGDRHCEWYGRGRDEVAAERDRERRGDVGVVASHGSRRDAACLGDTRRCNNQCQSFVISQFDESARGRCVSRRGAEYSDTASTVQQ